MKSSVMDGIRNVVESASHVEEYRGENPETKKYSSNNCETMKTRLRCLSMLRGFNATCFGSYTRSHNHADKTPQKNYYINCITLCYIIQVCSCVRNTTNSIRV